MSATRFTRAILLRSVAYGETDRIVTLFTEELGKISAIARGARRSVKRFGASLEPCAIIEVEVALGRGELGRLAQARIVRAFPRLLSDLERISLASAGLELVREAVDVREPEPRILAAIEAFFEGLDQGGGEPLFLSLSLRVLALIGLTPAFDACGRCGRPAPEGKAALFDPILGSIVCSACGGASIKVGGVLRSRLMTLAGRSFAEPLEWSPNEIAITRHLLGDFLRSHLGKELHGASLIAQAREVS